MDEVFHFRCTFSFDFSKNKNGRKRSKTLATFPLFFFQQKSNEIRNNAGKCSENPRKLGKTQSTHSSLIVWFFSVFFFQWKIEENEKKCWKNRKTLENSVKPSKLIQVCFSLILLCFFLNYKLKKMRKNAGETQ